MWDVNAFGLYSMDYGDSDHPALEVLRANFDAAYGGNRAPMPVFIHTPWLQANERAAADFVGEPRGVLVGVQGATGCVLATTLNPIWREGHA